MTIGLLLAATVVVTALVTAVRGSGTAGLIVLLAALLDGPVANVIGDAGVVGYIDDLALATVAVAVLLRRPNARSPVPRSAWLGFWVFALAGIASGIAHSPSSAPLLLGTWLAAKLPLSIWVMTRLNWTQRARQALTRATIFVLIVTLAVSAVELFAPTAVRAVFGAPPASSDRLGLTTIKGIFEHPVQSSTFALFATALLLGPAGGKRNRALGYLAAILALSSLRAKAVIDVAASLSVQAAAGASRITRQLAPGIILLIVGASLTIGWEILATRVADFLDSESFARNRLLGTAAQIAQDYAPFGAGFGQFGSTASVTYYSDVYFEYGLSDTYGFRPSNPAFATDSSWATVLGESGFIGAAGMILAVVVLVASLFKRAREARGPSWAIAASMFATVMAIDSIASPRLFDGFAAAALGALIAAAHAEREEHRAALDEEDPATRPLPSEGGPDVRRHS